MTAHQFSFNTGSNTQVTINVEQYASDGTTTDGNIYYDDFVMLKVIPKPEGNATPSNDGYITNGDFETGDLTGWTVEKGGNVTWTEVATGNFALQGTATAKYDAFVSQTVTVEKNTDYVITFKAKLAAAGGQPRFEVYGGSTRLNGGNYYFTGSTSWQTFQTAFNSGDNTTVVLKPGQGVDNGGDVYYDDIVMEKSSGYQGTAQQEKTIGADVRMMIYNVLADDDADTGFSFGKTLSKLLNGAEGTRDGAAASSIAYYAPDIVAFQEFTTNWYTGIRNALPNYEFINSTLDGKADYLCTALAYNKDTIELLNTELYAFTKNRWGNQRMRYMNIGFFKVKATGEEFIAISIHTDAGYLKDDPNKANQDINGDGIAEEADGYWRQFQIQEMIAKLNELTTTYKLPILCGGDYNSGLTGYYNDSTSYPQLIDAGFKDSTEGVAIDHIIYNGMANHLYNVIITDAAVAKNVTSDHSPVMADFQFLDEYSTPIASVVNNIKQQGRNTLKNGTLWLDFSASGIEFTANCEGTVALNLTVNSIKNTDATYGGVYFTVIVDGNKKDRALCRITETGTVTLTLAENLPAGNHTFEVYRQTEHRGAEIGISSITMNGTIGTKPADSNVYIEFIGDSISTGYGALGTSSSAGDANSPLYQDATVAYPYLTAKALGADFSDVCYSGIGAKYGWQDPNMHTFYPYQRWQYDRTTQYNFNSRQPNVVVIALGTNDIAMESEKGITVEQRLTGYQEFLDLVRAKNPNSKIIWIYGMMKDDDNARIPQIIENNGGAAAGLYSLELTTNTAGAGYHPSEAGQKKFAEELVAFINNNRLLSVTEMEDTDNLISYDGSSVMEATNGKLGVGYLFNAKISGVTIDDTYTADYTNAKAIINGVEYKLLGMGAVMTNQTSVGNNDDLMKLVSVNDKSVIDVPAVKVAVANADDCQFAVRIKNIPENHSVTAIYARPYYVIEMDGEETVVYGQTVARSYEGKLDINDGELEW